MVKRLEDIIHRYETEKELPGKDIAWLISQAKKLQSAQTDSTALRIMLGRNTNMRRDMRRK